MAGVNRTLDPIRPAPGNWLKKSPVLPPTHAPAEWSLGSCVEELSTDDSASENPPLGIIRFFLAVLSKRNYYSLTTY